jgi:hypothetical protein
MPPDDHMRSLHLADDSGFLADHEDAAAVALGEDVAVHLRVDAQAEVEGRDRQRGARKDEGRDMASMRALFAGRGPPRGPSACGLIAC